MDRNPNNRNTMTDTLFDIPESPSPRLKWIRDHQVSLTSETTPAGHPHWTAWVFPDTSGYGATEDEAIADLAKKLSIPLWNEA
jgi:hypothetical protein